MLPEDIEEERRAIDPVDFDYLKELGEKYLAHHGVEGQQWGVQNGPPYPLEGKGKRNFIQQAKEARKQKRRKKILKDPEKIQKHSDEFTVDEIMEALKKIDAVNEVKKRIPNKQLTRKQKKAGKDPASLIKNADKFNKEDFEKALDRLRKQREAQDMIIEDAKRPAKVIGVGNEYLRQIASGIGNLKSGTGDIIGLHDNFMLISGGGKMYKDQYSDRFPDTKKQKDKKKKKDDDDDD